MKKGIALFLVVLMSALVFTGCDWFKQDDPPVNPSNESDNTESNYEQRLEESEKFVEDFYNYLSTEDSYKTSPEELAAKYANVNAVEVKNNTSNDTFRVYWVSGDPTLYGNLEKEWTFIQWKDGSSICAKSLSERSGKKSTSAIINSEGIAVIGYDNVYGPKKIVVSLYKISGKDVLTREQGGRLEHDKYDFEKIDNDVYISSILYRDIYFENLGKEIRIVDENNKNEMILTFGTELTIQ